MKQGKVQTGGYRRAGRARGASLDPVVHGSRQTAQLLVALALAACSKTDASDAVPAPSTAAPSASLAAPVAPGASSSAQAATGGVVAAELARPVATSGAVEKSATAVAPPTAAGQPAPGTGAPGTGALSAKADDVKVAGAGPAAVAAPVAAAAAGAELGPLAKLSRLDVLGVKVGMLPDKVASVLSKQSPAPRLMFQGFNIETGVVGNRFVEQQPPGAITSLKVRDGSLFVTFALPPDSNEVVRLTRTAYFATSDASKATSRDTFLKALITKYGKPTLQTEQHKRGTDFETSDFLQWRVHPSDPNCTESPRPQPGQTKPDLGKVCHAILSIGLHSKKSLAAKTQTTLAAPRRAIDNRKKSKAHYDALKKKNVKDQAAKATNAPKL